MNNEKGLGLAVKRHGRLTPTPPIATPTPPRESRIDCGRWAEDEFATVTINGEGDRERSKLLAPTILAASVVRH